MEINKDYLASIGIRFNTEDEAEAFANVVQSELEIRIGSEISGRCSEDQLEEFDRLSDPNDAAEWLERNCPEYRCIVENEITKMEEELISYRSSIPGVIDTNKDNQDYFG